MRVLKFDLHRADAAALSGRVGINVTMAFHKWAAKVMIVVILLHPLLFLAPAKPEKLGPAFNFLVAMLGSPRYLTGVLALVLVVTIVLLAVRRNRLPVPTRLGTRATGSWRSPPSGRRSNTYLPSGPIRAIAAS
jgi:Ferric reductase like transmembrane component